MKTGIYKELKIQFSKILKNDNLSKNQKIEELFKYYKIAIDNFGEQNTKYRDTRIKVTIGKNIDIFNLKQKSTFGELSTFLNDITKISDEIIRKESSELVVKYKNKEFEVIPSDSCPNIGKTGNCEC